MAHAQPAAPPPSPPQQPLLIARLGPSPIDPAALGALRGLFEGLRATLLELGVPIDSFQGFSDEIRDLPYRYDEALGGALFIGLQPPPTDSSGGEERGGGGVGGDETAPSDPQRRGALLTVTDADSGARMRGVPVACIAFKAQPAAGPGAAEIKRLFVSPAARGRGHGRAMTLRLLAAAARAGYTRAVLDTLRRLPAAVALYRGLGFAGVPPYVPNPMEDVEYLGCALPHPAAVCGAEAGAGVEGEGGAAGGGEAAGRH